MNIEYTVIYPKVDHDNPSKDPQITEYGKQRSFTHVILAGRTSHDTLERIFAGWNNGSQSELPYFLAQHVRSMSVGDVVALYKPVIVGAEWFICDSCGWMEVNTTQAQSWLDFGRKFGCSSFELHQWLETQLHLQKES